MEQATELAPRTRRMSARYAVLGLLAERPGYQYQLMERLQERLGPAWALHSGHMSQIFVALAKKRLIERVDHGCERVPATRQVFAITEKGLAEFQSGFDENPGVRLPRRPLLAQITFAGPGRLQDALAKIDTYERECAALIQEVMGAYRSVPPDGSLLRADHVLLRLNLSADVAHLEGELGWAMHAREMISWLQTRGAVWPSSHDNATVGQTRESLARKALFARIARAKQDTRSSGEDQGED
jgi:DNA-binding PadR family transcriptional regulator